VAKIHWISAPTVSEDERRVNFKVIEALGLPKHKGAGRLAVVGGGPSIRQHADELRAWDGAVWAVNGAINWCIDQGIPAWFYTADSSPMSNWTYDLSRVRRAVLAPDCSPELVAYLQERGAEITLTAPLESGPTSANASDFLSIDAGYTHVTYFGCEGSFDRVAGTHAFASFPIPDWLVIDVGGEHYPTKAEFISQSIMLANTINSFPAVFAEKSGGLLSAMIKHGPDHDVYMVSNELFAKLNLPEKDAA
jgi:hypothetical protein